MPVYEFRCPECGALTEVFVRSVSARVAPPACPADPAHTTVRTISRFARHLDMATRLAEAEARFGPEVDAAMGPPPDVGRAARRVDAAPHRPDRD
jgi:putative FmdB family regulatory protein